MSSPQTKWKYSDCTENNSINRMDVYTCLVGDKIRRELIQKIDW